MIEMGEAGEDEMEEAASEWEQEKGVKKGVDKKLLYYWLLKWIINPNF